MNIEQLASDAVVHHGSQQKPLELAWLGEFLVRSMVFDMVEVGTYAGGTAWFFANLGINVISVDIALGNLKDHNQHERISHVCDYSTRYAETAEPVDFVFIDGDHTLPAVTADWEAWRPKTKLIAFHDIVVHDPPMQCDVSSLWAEIISQGYQTYEVADHDGSHWAGIGVVEL